VRSKSGLQLAPLLDSDVGGSDDIVRGRLFQVADQLPAVQQICGVPSISIAVSHLGVPIFQTSVGFRNIEDKSAATPDTTYPLSSCSKMILVAAVGILVDEGKMRWEDRIQRWVKDFRPSKDPNIGDKALISDALSHMTGLSCPQLFLLGPYRTIVGDRTNLIAMLNSANTSDGDEQRFSEYWLYNNLVFGLIGLAVEECSGMAYSEFVRERILEPLDMKNTAVSKEGLESVRELASNYTRLSGGSFSRFESEEYTCGSRQHTPVLAALGVQSSANDMSKFARAMLDAWKCERDRTAHDDSERSAEGGKRNPLKQVAAIWEPRCEQIVDDGFENEFAYCMGWYQTYMPTDALGLLSYNGKIKKYDPDIQSRHIIGRNSARRLALAHHGLLSGSTASVYVFPETQSAVVVLTNGATSADASDFVAKMSIQAIFDLQPHVDLFPLIEAEAKAHQRWFEDLVIDWQENRDVSYPEAPRAQYVGDYEAHGITLNIALREDSQLVMTFNRKKRTLCTLEYYNKDTYSFLPIERDRWLKDGMLDYDYYKVGLLEFRRNSAGDVDGLSWQYDQWDKEAWFCKKTREIRSPGDVTKMTRPADIARRSKEEEKEEGEEEEEEEKEEEEEEEEEETEEASNRVGDRGEQTGSTVGWRAWFKFWR
jgi:CubicO group peptidase (beta-lactamase class C family)